MNPILTESLGEWITELVEAVGIGMNQADYDQLITGVISSLLTSKEANLMSDDDDDGTT